jgi:hypothetical protein
LTWEKKCLLLTLSRIVFVCVYRRWIHSWQSNTIFLDNLESFVLVSNDNDVSHGNSVDFLEWMIDLWHYRIFRLLFFYCRQNLSHSILFVQQYDFDSSRRWSDLSQFSIRECTDEIECCSQSRSISESFLYIRTFSLFVFLFSTISMQEKFDEHIFVSTTHFAWICCRVTTN